MPEQPSIYSLTLNDLRDYLVSKGHAKFAADQIFQWIYKQGVIDNKTQLQQDFPKAHSIINKLLP